MTTENTIIFHEDYAIRRKYCPIKSLAESLINYVRAIRARYSRTLIAAKLDALPLDNREFLVRTINSVKEFEILSTQFRERRQESIGV